MPSLPEIENYESRFFSFDSWVPGPDSDPAEDRCAAVHRAATPGQSPGTISGLAAVFYAKNLEGSEYRLGPRTVERIDRAAFDSSDMSNCLALFNHDQSLVLGRAPKTLSLEITKRGLEYRGQLPDTTYARDLAVLIERGDISGASFGFIVGDDDISEERGQLVRHIRSIARVVDVSIVSTPAYRATSAILRCEDHRIARLRLAAYRRYLRSRLG